jgi:ATP-dependent DNA ligase
MYSKSGADYTARLPRMAEAFGKLPAPSAILDGELVLINPWWRALLPADEGGYARLTRTKRN